MSRTATICAALFAVATAGAVEAKTLRWAFQGDAQGLDPYVLNETFTLGFLGNVYEGLIRRGPDLEIQPALAERWVPITAQAFRDYSMGAGRLSGTGPWAGAGRRRGPPRTFPSG